MKRKRTNLSSSADKLKNLKRQKLTKKCEKIDISALNNSNDLNQKIVENYDIAIYENNITDLLNHSMTDDNVIDFYLKLICEKNNDIIYAFDSFFYTVLEKKTDSIKLKIGTKM